MISKTTGIIIAAILSLTILFSFLYFANETTDSRTLARTFQQEETHGRPAASKSIQQGEEYGRLAARQS